MAPPKRVVPTLRVLRMRLRPEEAWPREQKRFRSNTKNRDGGGQWVDFRMR
jgi:hypothetical protein